MRLSPPRSGAISIAGEDFSSANRDSLAIAGRRAFTKFRDDEEMPLICPTCQVAVLDCDSRGPAVTTVSSAPPQRGSDVGQDGFDRMHVIGNTELVGHGQQQG